MAKTLEKIEPVVLKPVRPDKSVLLTEDMAPRCCRCHRPLWRGIPKHPKIDGRFAGHFINHQVDAAGRLYCWSKNVCAEHFERMKIVRKFNRWNP